MRKSSGFILYDSKKRFLLQHRSADAPVWPNEWGIFGGGIEGDETPLEAGIREAKEELQIDIHDLKFFKHYFYDVGGHKGEVFIFYAPLRNSVEELKKKLQEGQGLGVFTVDEAKKLNGIDFDLNILAELNEFLFKD